MPSVRTTSLRSRCDHLRDDLAGLSPAYFGMAMATGIVSLSAHMQAWTWLASALFWLNASLYAGLWCLLLTRIAWHPGAVRADLLDHLRAPGFFTTVVATGVVGTQCLLIADSLRWAIALWCVALVLWLLLTYTIFTMLVVKEDKPPLDRGINGGWLLAVVATQAVAVLGTLIATRIPQPYRLELNFFALSMWLWGGMLYIWMMSLIFYRYTFFEFSPADLSPPCWINMGAMAISALAGSLLSINADEAPFLHSLQPFIKGFTILYWATGTWWIPMLLVLGVWRHLVRRFPLTYDPLYWGAVFPLGMYSTATLELSRAMDFGFLNVLPKLFFGAALVAWVATFAGVLRRIVGQARRG